MKRLPYWTFKLPYGKIRAGYYTDKYFLRTKEILIKDKHNPTVLYQFFLKKDAVVCGVDEALAVLKTCSGYYKNLPLSQKIFGEIRKLDKKIARLSFKESAELKKLYLKRVDLRKKLNNLWINKYKTLKINALFDGEKVKKNDIILTIDGPAAYIAYLETVLLGIISRATSTATAVKKVIDAAGKKPVLFFSARFDHFWNQTADGYAALKAGAFGVSTDAQGDWWGVKSMGTIPHSLIASYGGSTEKAAIKFNKYIPQDVKRIVLVDWDNDCIGTTFNVLNEFYFSVYKKKPRLKSDYKKIIGGGKNKIWAVRFDTAENLTDKSLTPKKNNKGVCRELVLKARKIFNDAGLNNLKIVVSGGFDSKKIKMFEKTKTPADVYGVGSSLLKEKVDITADIVKVDGVKCAKKGRKAGDYKRLQKISN